MTIRMQNVFLCGLATMAGWASYTLLPAQEVQREPGNTGVIKGKLNGAETFFVTGNTIKGAPYSAEAVTESTQVLADGNRIVRTNKEKLYRDGQGRQRSEVIAADGTAGPVTISDPVANSTLAVNPRTRTVQKAPFMRFRVNAGGTGVAEIQTLVSELASVQAGARGGARGGAPPEGGAGGRGTPAGVRLEGRLIAPGSENAPKREDLGSRNVEGVIASGTRTTRTIPAGQVGNQQPI